MSQLVVCFIDQSILFDDVDIRENCLRMACVELQDWRLLIITPSAPCLPALYQGTQWNGSNQFLRLHSLSPCPFEPPRRGRSGLDQPRPHANSRYPSQRRRLGNYGNDASSPTSLTEAWQVMWHRKSSRTKRGWVLTRVLTNSYGW